MKVHCRIEEGCGDHTGSESSITIARDLGTLYCDGRHSPHPLEDLGELGELGDLGDLGDWGAWRPRALAFWFGQVLVCCWYHPPVFVFFDVRPHLAHLVAGMYTVTRVDQL